MKENIRMLVVLTVICGACGFLLAGVQTATNDRIIEQVLKNVQGPAVQKVLATSTNDLIADRKNIDIGDNEVTVFIGKKQEGTWAIAFETSAGGFGGKLGVIVGYNLENDELTGIGITTCSETPGIGLRVKEDSFTDGFKGKSITDDMNRKEEGGVIDGVSGASVSSKAVCAAVKSSIGMYEEIKGAVGAR